MAGFGCSVSDVDAILACCSRLCYGLVAMVKVRSISKTNPRAVSTVSVAVMAGRRSAFAVYQQLQKEAAEEHAAEERVRCVLRSRSSCCVVFGGEFVQE